MDALSKNARLILDRMDPGRCYESVDLRAFLPDASAEGLRDLMQELWVNRQVERVGYAGWRRHRSVTAHQSPADARRETQAIAPASGFRQTKVVKPEDLFDHASFTDLFK